MNKVRFGNSLIEYSVVKSKRRKTSEIIVDKNGVMVRAPSSKPNSEIKKIVKEKSRWIYKKQLQFNAISQQKLSNKKYSEQYLKRRV
ncbi:MAG: M48 family metallopeptidase, partial [Thaumarchaeota archaeon]|nr:M48 family metallopeptidase [Nitrososphaerota archaeon]